MTDGRFRFGIFELDAGALELRRAGVVVRLQEQPARVLACLVERADEVVSREDLCGVVWSNDTFVDFERGLNFCIAQVRAALDDDSAAPRFVRTIPKRGYQFIAPVERVGVARADATLSGAATGGNGRFSVPRAKWIWVTAVLAVLAMGAGYWLKTWQVEKRTPIVAVLRFDNETGDAGMMPFADALTDDVVESLTRLSGKRYDVIGNARILRVPREERDLAAIAASLHAGYVVLGQVQSAGEQTRVLAHLIRLPDQTHVWVTRLDRTIADPLGVESEVAERVGREFSARVAQDSSGGRLSEFASH